ncbi:MAG: glycosyltransferase [Candidatus Micrarchaeaceae archaeon]
MKLVVTHHNLNERGGAEKVLLKIAQRYDAPIYTLGYDKNGTFEEFKDLDVRVFSKKGLVSNSLPPRVGNAVYYGFNFYNFKIPEDYDVVNPHSSPSEWIRNRNPRALWYCHTPPRELYDPTVANLRKKTLKEKVLYKSFSGIYSKIENKVVKYTEAIATNSDNTKAKIKSIFNRNATVITPGVEPKDFINEGYDKYFLYPSRIAEQKRQEYAIEAFQRFCKITRIKGYKLIIAGGLSKRYDDFETYYKKLKAKRAKDVKFVLNPTDEKMKELYSRCTAVLFTAINEDLGIVPLEGMASSKPVISVNEGGPKETIINAKTGFLVNSEEEMARKMKFIIENRSIAEKIGKEARRRVERHYSWDVFFNKFDLLAKNVSKNNI